MSLSSNGVLSGTPAAGNGGVWSGTISASNPVGTYGSSDSQSYTLTVQEPPGLNAGSPPGPALLDSSYYYSFAYNASGFPAATYSLTSGIFPTGLTMNSGGILSGKPTVAGSFSGVVTAANGIDPAATQNFTITVQPPTPPVFTNGSPPAVTLGAPYNFTFNASCLPPATLSLTSGSLPPGIFMVASYVFINGHFQVVWTGSISGTPTVAGAFHFSVTAANGANPNAVQDYTITVYPTAYGAWSSQYFTTGQLADPTAGGPAAMPQNDGFCNLLKYFFGINPARPMSAADRVALPAAGTTMVGGVRYLTLSYRKNAAASGISLYVDTSSKLQAWTPVPNPIIVQAGTDPNTGDPIMQVQVAVTGPSQFIRLRVTSP